VFGYVRPAPARLDTAGKELFRSAYCGLCHTLGRRYGWIARFLLNFDFTLLAILLSLNLPTGCAVRRCAVHPCRGCRVLNETEALCIAADYSVVLAWWQIQDHIADHGFFAGLKYRLAALLLRRAYRKARGLAPAFDEAARRHLGELDKLEKARCASLDEASEPFASLLAELAEPETDETRRRILRQLFYHLGRWIYLIDAADDLKKDSASGAYNPIKWRFDLRGDELPDEVKLALGETLDASIRRMANAYALLDAGEWTPVLDSIFYDSLYAIGRAVLDGTYHKPSRIRRGRKTEGTTI